jgi:hypothetical protein
LKRNLYKVKIEIELCVLAKDSQEAIVTAKENASNEIQQYSSGLATPLNKEVDIPKSWLDCVPYVPYGAISDNKTCKQVIYEIVSKKNDAQNLDDEDMKEVLKVHEELAQKVIDDPQIKPESKSDPKPKELQWKAPERKMPQLRF